MRKTFYLGVLIISLIFQSCSKDDDSNVNTPTTTNEQVIDNYVNIVHTSYANSVASAKIFNQKLKDLNTNKDAAALNAAKTAWKEAREDYQPTEAFRFFGPIEEVIAGSSDLGYEVAINAWPLDESAVDGFISNNSTFNETLFLSEFNEDDLISIGWHPIEYILWGEDPDKSNGSVNGTKVIADFTDNEYAYLVAAGDVLVKYLEAVTAQWAPGGTFRSSFTNGGSESVQNILTALGTLANAELGGERTLDPFNGPGVDAEHSCFSDNTNRDNSLNWEGIVGVYQGKLAGFEGSSVEDLIKEKDAELAARITSQIALVDEIMVQIENDFFEDVIKTGSSKRNLIFKEADINKETLISRLTDFGNLILEAGNKLELDVTVE